MKYQIEAYSATPAQDWAWNRAARAFERCVENQSTGADITGAIVDELS